MNRDDIIRMAREANILELMGYDNPHMKQWNADVVRELELFAKLVAAQATAKEREACAKLAETIHETSWPDTIAAAIRARGEA